MARRFTPACLLALALGLAWPGGAAHAQEDEAVKARAKELFQKGVADFDAARFDQALAAFQEAYRLKPHPMVRVNMANCYDKLDRPVEAIFHFEQVLDSKEATPDQKKDITTAVRRLKKKVSDVTVNVSPDGAIVVLDGGEQRRAPLLEPVRVIAGKHEIAVHLEGFESVHRKFETVGGKPTEIAITLERAATDAEPVVAMTPATAPADAPAPAPVEEQAPAQVVDASAIAPMETPAEAPAAEEPSRGIPTGVWVAGGATVALGVATVIAGLMAKSAESDFDDSKNQYLALRANATVSAQDKVALFDIAVDDADRARALAITTDVLLAATAVGAGLTLYLYLSSRPSATESGSASLKLTPAVSPQRADLILSGTF